jgi:hypothetical protein
LRRRNGATSHCPSWQKGLRSLDTLAAVKPLPRPSSILATEPKRNEFCVLRSESERPDPYAHLVV